VTDDAAEMDELARFPGIVGGNVDHFLVWGFVDALGGKTAKEAVAMPI